jgi:hypothetical protein
MILTTSVRRAMEAARRRMDKVKHNIAISRLRWLR